MHVSIGLEWIAFEFQFRYSGKSGNIKCSTLIFVHQLAIYTDIILHTVVNKHHLTHVMKHIAT